MRVTHWLRRFYTRFSVRLGVLGAVLVVTVYVALFGIYHPFHIDDEWFPSFSYNLCKRHAETDLVFGGEFPEGMGGTVAFGKVPAYLQCGLLDFLGWNIRGVYLASIILSTCAGALLFAFVRRRSGSWEVALGFIVLLPIMESFFAMANCGRYESATLLLAVLALVLHQRDQLAAAGFVAGIAIESQPIGIVAALYLACLHLEANYQRMRPGRDVLRRLSLMGSGFVLSLGVYVWLHPGWRTYLGALTTSAKGTGQSAMGSVSGPLTTHYLYSYFFQAKYLRHLPELVVVAAALARRVLKDRIVWDFPVLATLATIGLGFVLRHANYQYAVFFVLPAYLLVFEVIVALRWSRAALVLSLVWLLPQYCVVYSSNRAYRHREYLARLRGIAESHRDARRPIIVYGHYNAYFAFVDADFRDAQRLKSEAPPLGYQRVLICPTTTVPADPDAVTCDQLLGRFGLATRIDTVTYGAATYGVYLGI